MNAKVLLIHARNQIRTVWLMSGTRFGSPYDIQIRNPSLALSLLAVLAAQCLTAMYDYLNYTVDPVSYTHLRAPETKAKRV